MSKSILKFLSLLVIVCLILSVSACSSKDKDIDKDSKKSTATQTTTQATTQDDGENKYDPLGKYDETVEVTAVGILYPVEAPVPESTTPENQSFNKLAEQFLNIKIKYLWTVAPDQYSQKFNVSIASGDIPDLIYTTEPTQFQNLLESGLLADLTEAYNYLLPELKRMYEEDVPEVLNVAKLDGKLWALPMAANRYEAAQKIYIRKDWLDNLNLKVPTTYKELADIAVAFAKQDPDGNNKDDTIGLAIHKDILWGGSCGSLPFFEMFHAYPGSWIKGEDGKLHDTITSPEMKNALAALQDLYKRGAIDREFATKDVNKVIEELSAGLIGIAYGEWWTPSWPFNIPVEQIPGADWVSIPNLSADDKPATPAVKRVMHNGFNAVSSKCEHPEAAVKLINLFYDCWYNPNYLEIYGDLVKPENGFFYNYVPQKLWDAMSSEKEFLRCNEAIKTRDPSKLPTRDLANYNKAIAYLDNGDLTGWGIYNCMMADDGGYAYVVQMHKNNNVVYDEFYGVATPAMVEKGDTLSRLATETFIRIIMGNPISEFDEFVKEYNELGGLEIEKEVNDWYAQEQSK